MKPETNSIERLLIVTYAVHYRHGGKLHSYTAYVREIDRWADLFTEVVITGPCRDEAPPSDCCPFDRDNVSIIPQPETGGRTRAAKIWQILLLPWLVWNLAKHMRGYDAIHVRCPGNFGLLGLILAPLFSRNLVAKYAAQWVGVDREPISWRLQRWLLRSRWWRGPATVYGEWPNEPRNIVPFFTSVMTEEHIQRARSSSAKRKLDAPIRALFVGRLSAAKSADVLLTAVAAVKRAGLDISATIVGHGPERDTLEKLCDQLDIRESVEFTGGVSFERVLEHYEQSDVLVLASKTPEGWPKAIAEGMAFGLICVGPNRGFVPQMLGDGRGFVVEPGDAAQLTELLTRIAKNPAEHLEISRRAAAWSQQYSLDKLAAAIRELLNDRWQTELPLPPRQPSISADCGVSPPG